MNDPTPPERRRRQRRRWIAAAICALVVGGAAFHVFDDDELIPDDDILLPTRNKVADLDNGWVLLLRAIDGIQPHPTYELSELVEYYQDPNSTITHDEIEIFVQSNGKALEAMVAAIEHEPWSIPSFDEMDDDDEGLEHFLPMSVMAFMHLVAHAAFDRKENQRAVALVLVRIQFTGRRLAFSRTAIEHLLAVGEHRRAIEVLRKRLVGAAVAQLDIASLNRRLLAEAPKWDDLVHAIRGEYGFEKVPLTDFSRIHYSEEVPFGVRYAPKWLPVRLIFKPNRTQNRLGSVTRRYLAMENPPFSAFEDIKFYFSAGFMADESREETSRTVYRLLTGNLAGIRICDSAMSLVRLMAIKHFSAAADLHATRLILALRAYELDHSSLPATLRELVPKYIDSIPIDPFDQQPFRYSPEDKCVYSVGTNLKDEGGSLGEGGAEEPTWFIHPK